MKRYHLLCVLLCWHTFTWAQVSAETYFHDAAQQFIQGQAQEAGSTIAEGLTHHPNDPELQKLKALLEQPPQQQQQQQEQQEEQSDEQEQSQPQDQQQSANPPEQSEGSNQQSSSQEPPPTASMNQADVERLLNALQQHEGQVQEKIRQKQRPRTRPTTAKDW